MNADYPPDRCFTIRPIMSEIGVVSWLLMRNDGEEFGVYMSAYDAEQEAWSNEALLLTTHRLHLNPVKDSYTGP